MRNIKIDKIKINLDSIFFCLLVFIFAVYPYVFWLNIFLNPVVVLGKNLFIFMITMSFVMIFSLNFTSILHKIGGYLYLCIVLLLAIVLFARMIFYDESLNSVVSCRYTFLIFIYLGVFVYYFLLKDKREIIFKIIIINCFAQIVAGIVHHYFFPHIVTGIAYDATNKAMYILSPGEGGLEKMAC